MINTFASAAYAFLPILVGFSATKMFGGNPYLGAVMGMIMVSGDLLNAYSYGTAITEGTVPVWHIGALTIEKVGYQELYFRYLQRQQSLHLSRRNFTK